MQDSQPTIDSSELESRSKAISISNVTSSISTAAQLSETRPHSASSERSPPDIVMEELKQRLSECNEYGRRQSVAHDERGTSGVYFDADDVFHGDHVDDNAPKV